MIGAYMHNCTVVPRWFKFSVSVRDVNGTLKHTAEVSTKRMEPESGWGLASFCSKHTLTKVRACVGPSLILGASPAQRLNLTWVDFNFKCLG